MADSQKGKIDMTTGHIMKNIILFAIPIIIGNVLQQLYTTVDALVIGKYCGDTSLAAVGTSSQPVEVLLCVFLGIGTGVSILISQYTGARESGKVVSVCGTSITFIYIIGIPIGILGWFAAPYILEFMKVPQDVWDAALIYTRVVFLGTLGNLGYNMNAGILRGLGDSKASLWFLVVSCVSNIVFDLLFVAGFGMDVAGAALSTSIAMFISWIVSIVYIRKKFLEIQFTFLPRRFSGTMMKDILAIGLPIGLNNSLYSLGHVALQTFNNSQGAIFMAGGAVAGRITGCANIAITGLSSAATTFSGQNYGAKKYSRIKEGHWRIPLCSGLITLSFGLFFIMIHKPIIRFFSSDEMVLMYASRHVVVMLLSQWFFAIFNCIISIVNGTGKVRYTTIVNILMLWAVRIPSAYIINRYFDGTWVMLCFPISFSFGMFAMIGYYLFSPSWKELMRIAENKQNEVEQNLA